MKRKKRIKKAIKLAVKYSHIDGSHHKDWIIDQMIRILAEDKYEKIINEFDNGYGWNDGIPP